MENNQIDKNSPVIEPVFDTWGGKKDAGYWGLDGQLEWLDFSVEEINNWYAESLVKTLDAFSSLARIWEVVLINDGELRNIGGILKLGDNISYEQYVQSTLNKIRKHPIFIYEIQFRRIDGTLIDNNKIFTTILRKVEQ